MPPKESKASLRLSPMEFIHVLDSNENIRRLEAGPKIFNKMEHEIIIKGPEHMVILPPNHYCIILNPVVRDSEGEIIFNKYKEPALRIGKEEIRTNVEFPEPFPLYPGEELKSKILPFQVIPENSAFLVSALCDFIHPETKELIHSSDQRIIKGPATYKPSLNEEVIKRIDSIMIKPNWALVLKAKINTKDYLGNEKMAGEKWIVRKEGSYLPSVDEIVVEQRKGEILNEKVALHLVATSDFTDIYKIPRKAGEEWLITKKESSFHIVDIHERLIEKEVIINLSNKEYCFVSNYIGENGKRNYGQRELRVGPRSFFLNPGESIKNGIEKVIVLEAKQALVLKAITDFPLQKKKAGEKWMIRGPCEYIPPVEVEIFNRRETILLSENDGIYVRNRKTGEVRLVRGGAYMLDTHEEIWKKELPTSVEKLLYEQHTGKAYQTVYVNEKGERIYNKEFIPDFKRDKTKAVTFKVPHNSAVLIFDYKTNEERIIFGPNLIMLNPYEDVMVLKLSGDLPKREKVHQNLALLLGPDFMVDLITVETSDHAKLILKLGYKWQFLVDKNDPVSSRKIFNVFDFVGMACKSIASKVRGSISSVDFDHFHRNSIDIIRRSLFKKNEKNEYIPYVFRVNNLCISQIDIQSVEPFDAKTKASLLEAVSLSIKISTESLRMMAKHDSEREEEKAKGEIAVLEMKDKIKNEDYKRISLEKAVDCMTIEKVGECEAKAKAIAEAELVNANTNVETAKLEAEAMKIKSENEIELLSKKYKSEEKYIEQSNLIEIATKEKMANIEADKFCRNIEDLGKETIVSMCRAGPETQAKLLGGLGLQGYMILDSKNPINLINTANGMINPSVPH